MIVAVFSDTTGIKACFARVEKSKSLSLSYHSQSDLKKKSAEIPPGSVIYADITGFTLPAVKKLLALLASLNRVFGILDPKNSSADPASFFLSGASDYIGKSVFRDGIDTARIGKVFNLGNTGLTEYIPEPVPASAFACELSGDGWKNVIPGRDYTFCFMYIELDNQKDIKKRFTGKKLEEFTVKFHSFVEKFISDIHGRIWMWADLGGLALFPFNGNDCPAVCTGFNLMLNRRIISFENFDYDMLLSFRIAVHIGNTTYRERGETGRIVSDSINSIHHLKQYFAEPGNMYLTEDVHRYIPENFRPFFVQAGIYEGREIYRLLKLL